MGYSTRDLLHEPSSRQDSTYYSFWYTMCIFISNSNKTAWQNTSSKHRLTIQCVVIHNVSTKQKKNTEIQGVVTSTESENYEEY